MMLCPIMVPRQKQGVAAVLSNSLLCPCIATVAVVSSNTACVLIECCCIAASGIQRLCFAAATTAVLSQPGVRGYGSAPWAGTTLSPVLLAASLLAQCFVSGPCTLQPLAVRLHCSCQLGVRAGGNGRLQAILQLLYLGGTCMAQVLSAACVPGRMRMCVALRNAVWCCNY